MSEIDGEADNENNQTEGDQGNPANPNEDKEAARQASPRFTWWIRAYGGGCGCRGRVHASPPCAIISCSSFPMRVRLSLYATTMFLYIPLFRRPERSRSHSLYSTLWTHLQNQLLEVCPIYHHECEPVFLSLGLPW